LVAKVAEDVRRRVDPISGIMDCMVAARNTPHGTEWSGAIPVNPRDVDQRIILNGISWRDYCVLRELLDSPGVRTTYLKGVLEVMSPSRLHGGVKKQIARLLELYILDIDLDVLASYAAQPDQHVAVVAYRDHVRAGAA
jgi:hypothetical protein